MNAGLAQAARIEPLGVNGRPSATGQIVLLSIAMSEYRQRVRAVIQEARREPAVTRRLVIVNGALGSADATMWANPASPAWLQAKAAVRGRYSPAQVQVVWMKHALRKTSGRASERPTCWWQNTRTCTTAGSTGV